MSLYGISETYHSGFSTYDATGALVAADSTPTGVLVVNGSDTAATVTITTSSTGDYKIAADLSGRSVGDDCLVRYSATVGGITQHGRTAPFRVAFAAALSAPVTTGSFALDGGVVSASPAPTTTTFTATGANLGAPSGGYTVAPMSVLWQSGALASGRTKYKVIAHSVAGSLHSFTVAAMPNAPSAGDTFVIG